MVDRGLVDGLGVVLGLRVVLGLVLGLGVVSLGVVDLMGLSVVGVLDVHDGARVLVGHIVGHGLEAAVREGDMVAAIGGVAVPGLVGTKLDGVGVGVVGIDSVLVLVLGRAVLGLFVTAIAAVLGLGGMVGGGVVGQGDGQEDGKGDEDLHCCDGVIRMIPM